MSELLVWVVVAFGMTASAGAMVLVNKRLTRCLDPVATNMLVRGGAVATIAVISAPLSLLHLWSLTYDITWEAAGYVALIAVVGWFVAQTAYYHALRSAQVLAAADLPSDRSPTLTYPAEHGSRRRGALWGARGASRLSASCRLPSEAPLAVQLFPADGVTWVVSLPAGLVAETIWPDMESIEAFALVPEVAETEQHEEVCAA